jgi:hypothetical protein
MHGVGHYIWGDGREYVGGYKNGKKSGFGKYTWADGRRYTGYWDNGKQNGIGKYIMTGGTYQYGIWNRGKRVHWLTDEEIKSLEDNEQFKLINAE